jgi:predicted O-methyltransferase YrrM
MKHTNIWAIEEVLFPTVVKLLGYNISSNPCSQDYVRYKYRFNAEHVRSAIKRNDAYWIHPVERKYGDPLRKYIREHFNHYVAPSGNANEIKKNDGFSVFKILDEIHKIHGWLSDREADLLIRTTFRACENSSDPIVEIGSFHGKATVAMGSVLKAFYPDNRIFAIDPHDGRLGASDRKIEYVTPSFDRFRENIRRAGLEGVVKPIRDHSNNVKWDKPISLLLIDGLHDYPSVSGDFFKFSDWIKPGGFVAFHDYADYFPGVKAFVDELLTGEFERFDLADSLIVLRKM